MSNSNKKKPTIVLTEHTPYMVSGLENFYNSKGEPLPVKNVMSLCRCGLSKKKPFCDGSHNEKGLDCEKKPDRVKDRVMDFKGKDITIHDNRGVCSHDRSCVNDLPSVFQKGKRRWIQPDNAGVKEIVNTIEKCPSGALSYSIGKMKCTEIEREPTITIAKNGPLEITGGIILDDDMDSKPQSPEHYTLCRCGGSKNPPFCDGTHLENGFEDEEN